MKPNFALNLSHEGIDLFHRGKSGWTPVGTVSLDDPDLGGALDVLRKTAVSLESGGMTSKIIIPDSQILYTEIDLPEDGAASTEARAGQIRDRLVGMTPYAVDDLVYDWKPAGPGRVQLAVVSRETLAEAEAFASEYRFNPVSFAARPPEDKFGGEPFFGPAGSATALIADQGDVEPDTHTIDTRPPRVAPTAPDDGAALADHGTDDGPGAGATVHNLRKDEAAAEAPVAIEAEVDAVADAAAEAVEEAAQEVKPAFASRRAAGARDEVIPQVEIGRVQPAAPPEDLRPTPRLRAVPATPAPAALPDIQSFVAADESEQAEAVTDEAGTASTMTPDPARGRTDEGEKAEAGAQDEVSAAEEGGDAEVAPPVEDTPTATDGSITAASIPADVPGPAPSAMRPAPAADDDIPPMPSALWPARPGSAPPVERPAEGATPKLDAAPKPEGEVLRRLPSAAPRPTPSVGAASRRAPVVDFKPKAPAAPAAEAPLDDVPPMPSARTARNRADVSVFGATKPARRRSPAVVVVLTLALLVLLGGLAVWSTFWGDDPAVEDQAATGSDAAATDVALADVPSPEDESTAPVMDDIAAGDAAMDDEELADIAAGAEVDLSGPQLDTAAEADAAPDMPAEAGSVDLAAAPEAMPDEPAPETPALAAAAPEPAVEAPVEAADAAPADAETADVAAVDAAEVDDEALADGEPEARLEPVPDTPALPADPQTELVGTDEGAAARVAAQLAEDLTPEEAARRYDASGIWVLPPAPPAEPGVESADDVYVAAVDNDIAGQDAVALSEQPAPDKRLLSPLPPPAFGTTFDFDENGLVRATPDGALNPDGIAVFLGEPPVVPKPRPSGLAPETPAADTPQAEVDDSGLPRAPGVPKVRPKWRPDDLTELNEKANLGGRTKVELAALRPRQRPEVIVELARAVAAPETPETEAALKELAPATKLAVASSRLPKARPSNIDRIVAEALREPPPPAAAAAPAPQPVVVAVVPTPKVADTGTVDEADDEPTLASAAAVVPKVAAGGSVAKTATIPNALKLRELNLIGVYGTPKARRALVRTSNGKYVKVKVGDRLDGGKVAAIGDSELIYVKGGRQHRLQMPAKT